MWRIANLIEVFIIVRLYGRSYKRESLIFSACTGYFDSLKAGFTENHAFGEQKSFELMHIELSLDFHCLTMACKPKVYCREIL